MGKIKVLVKAPAELCEVREIENELETFQRIVGGYIEVIRYTDDILCICNEEGKLLDLEPNIFMEHDVLCGTVIFCGQDGEEFSDFPFEPHQDEDWTHAVRMER